MRMTTDSIMMALLLVCLPSCSAGQAPRRFGDVQNIGNGTASGVSDIISMDKELSIGATIAAEFDKSVRLIGDPAVVNLINRIGQSIVKHSDAKMPCQFKVLDSDEMDVWSLLGGHIYVTKGLIMTAENEAELAGALAHGIAHVALRDTARLLDKAKYLEVGAIPASPFGHWSNLKLMAPQLQANLESMAATQREFEDEADQLGVQYLWNSGYDPNAYITLLQRLLKREKELSGTNRRLLPFIPATGDRIAASARERSQLPPRENYVLTTSEFDRVKTNLFRAQKAEDITDTPVQKRPKITRKAE